MRSSAGEGELSSPAAAPEAQIVRKSAKTRVFIFISRRFRRLTAPGASAKVASPRGQFEFTGPGRQGLCRRYNQVRRDRYAVGRARLGSNRHRGKQGGSACW